MDVLNNQVKAYVSFVNKEKETIKISRGGGKAEQESHNSYIKTLKCIIVWFDDH